MSTSKKTELIQRAQQVKNATEAGENTASRVGGLMEDIVNEIPEEQVQADWNQTNSQAKDFIKNKPTIPAALTVDSEPTEDSQNPVSSGGVYEELAEQGLHTVNMTKLDVPEATGGTAPADYAAGYIFYEEVQYDKFTGFRYYVALVAGNQGDLVSDTSKFYPTLSSAEAVKLSEDFRIPDTQVQSDWNQTNTQAKDFIKNKPTIPDTSNFATKQEIANKVDKVIGKGLSTNDYTNEDKAKVAAAITEHQDISGKADKSEVVAEQERAEATEAQLRALYEAVNKDDIIPVAAGDWPLQNLQENVVYRVAGTTSFTDYMYDGTNAIPMATHTYGDDITTQLTADETIANKYIYKRGQLTNGYSDYYLLKFDISDLSGAITLISNSVENESVYAYAIYNDNGVAISYPKDTENIINNKEFEIDLSTLEGYKYLYVAGPGEAFNIIKGEISVLSEEVQNLSDDVKAMESKINISIPKTYNDAIKLNLLLNSQYNTFVICGNGGAFYKIDRGTKVEITAKSNQDAACAFLNTVPAEIEGTPADYMSGESLHTIPMGTTSLFIAPDNGYIYIQNTVWGTNKFPDSVTFITNGVEYLSDEIANLTDTPEKNRLFVNGLTFRYKDLEKVNEGNVTNDMIFSDANNGFITTDYIEIEPYSIKPYCIYLDTMSASFKLLEFYDKDKNAIATVRGTGPTGVSSDFNKKILKINFPTGCKYVRYARYGNYNNLGLFKANVVNMENITNEFVQYSAFTDTNNVLWLGTSIPEGATYPVQASLKCGYSCINNSLGSSSLCWSNVRPATVNENSGKHLTATVAELEAMFRQDVTAGTISEATLEMWKNKSYERSVIPYIDGTNANQVSMIVVDHGFNDRGNIYEIMQNADDIDWTSKDRSNFVGAFNYLLSKIQEINPTVKIVIAGYFQNTYIHSSNPANDYHSAEICEMQELIAKHYSISIMKAWEHSQINNAYISGTSNYLEEFNAEYGTSYQKYSADDDGNIKSMQLYCPDMVHPHSDKTGNCDKRLNAVYSKLLADLI